MYPAQPLTLTWGGQIGNTGAGADIWQCGLHLGFEADASTPVRPGEAALGELYTDAIEPFHSRANTYIQRGAVLSWAKIVTSKVDGKYLTEPVTWNGTGTPGQVNDDNGAPQDSIVITLWTGAALGKGNYGRFYLPWNGKAAEGNTGRISVTARDNIADSALTFIRAVNSWAAAQESGLEVLIYGSTGAGTKKRPVQLRVGDVVDTQRRRRNRIAENYAARVINV